MFLNAFNYTPNYLLFTLPEKRKKIKHFYISFIINNITLT